MPARVLSPVYKFFSLSLLLALLPTILALVHSSSIAYAEAGQTSLSLVVELPPGQKFTGNSTVELPLPGEYLFWVVAESKTRMSTEYRLEVLVEGDASLESLSGPLKGVLSGYGDRAIVYGVVKAGASGFRLVVVLEARDYTQTLALTVSGANISARFSRVYLPVDYLGREDPQKEPFTLTESYPSLLGKLLGGGSGQILLGHMLVCVESSKPTSFLLIGRILDASGNPAPIASTIIVPGVGSEYLRAMINTEEYKGDGVYSGCIVIPLWALEDIVPPGTYSLTLELYIPGTARPLTVYKSEVYVKLIGYGDVATALLTASLGALTLPFLGRISDGRRLAYMALVGASITVLVRLVGGIVFRLSWVLGPFDWVVHGFITSGLYYGLLAGCLAATRDPLVAAGAVVVEWLLSNLVLGGGNLVLSSLWMLTTVALVALAGYVARHTSLRLLPVYMGLAKAVDGYVDLNIYAFTYRLYYAKWYIVSYSLGTAFYAFLGSLLVLRMVYGHARSQD